MTVSRALRDAPKVSVKRRAEIKALAQKLGYKPDPMLSALSAYRDTKKPIIVRSCLAWFNQWENPTELRSLREFDAYWRGAEEAADKLGCRLEEFRWPYGKSGVRLQSILETRGVRGILLPPHRNGLNLPDFNWELFSIIRFGSSVLTPRVHIITSDQSHCARLAYQKAHEKGYRRIGYISDRLLERNTLGHFREGYLNAQEELALKKDHLQPLLLDQNASERTPLLLHTWLRSQRPEAVITTAGYLRESLVALGVKTPSDLAVAGVSLLDCNFDSGVDQNSFEIGRVAVNTLCDLIFKNERGPPPYVRRILVEGSWSDGSSLPDKMPLVKKSPPCLPNFSP